MRSITAKFIDYNEAVVSFNNKSPKVIIWRGVVIAAGIFKSIMWTKKKRRGC